MFTRDVNANAELGPRERFFRYNYTETKEFCLQFLTLVVAVLVFSLTFTDKVVEFPEAPFLARLSLTISWALMLLAIISCGVGLTLMALAGGDAVYGGSRYLKFADGAYKLIVVAGGLFIAGLLLLIVAATVSLTFPRPNRLGASPPAARQPGPTPNPPSPSVPKTSSGPRVP